MKILIAGGSFAGVSAAYTLGRKGHDVSLIDARAYLGGDAAASLHTWAYNGKTRFMQPNGQLKMELYGKLMDAGVKVLLTARIAGIMTRPEESGAGSGAPCGLLLATKYGIMEDWADLVIDATEDGLCAQALTGELPEVHQAEFSFDIGHVNALMQSTYAMPPEFGLTGNCVQAGLALKPGTVNIGFGFPVDPMSSAEERTKMELKAHQLMLRIAEELKKDENFAEGVIEITGSHLRPLVEKPVRHPFISFVDAHLPAFYTLQERRNQEEQAAEKALELVQPVKTMTPEKDHPVKLMTPEKDHPVKLMTPEKDQPVKTMTPEKEQPVKRMTSPVEEADYVCFGKKLAPGSIRRKVARTSAEKQIAGELSELGLCPVSIQVCQGDFREKSTTVLVAGMGTAGTMSGWALMNHQTDCLLIDQFYFCGGSNTVGRVGGAWHGYTGGMFKERYHQVSLLAQSPMLNERMGAQVFWEKCFQDHFIGGLFICGILQKKRRIEGVLACGPRGFEVIRAQYIIDGTADGDLCALAGIPYEIGGIRDGNLQTSSMWGFEYRGIDYFGMTRYNSDEDEVNPDSYYDYLRGLGLGYLRNSEYEIVEMCMQRESRRFTCLKALTMKEIAHRRCHEDDIAVALCTHDTHGRASSLLNQYNLYAPAMIEEGSKDVRVRMPWGMFLPEGLDNVAIVGKSMSGEREAVNLCRMNPDIANTGYAVGTVVSHAVLQQAEILEKVNLTKAREELSECGVLPSWAKCPGDQLEVEEALENLSDPADHGFSAMVQDKEKITKQLLENVKEEGVRGDNAAMALAWHGCPEGSSRILEMLQKALPHDVVRFEMRPNYELTAIRADGFEKRANKPDNYGYTAIAENDPDLSYEKINRLLLLLGLAGGEGAEEICKIGESFFPGDILTGHRPYSWSRADGWKLAGDRRIWALIHACERLGDPILAPMLEKIMDQEILQNLHCEKGVWGPITAPRVVQADLGLARAAAHCGSLKGVQRIASYLEDSRSVFVKMAVKALEEVFGKKDLSPKEWKQWAEQVTEVEPAPYRGNPFEG